MLFRSPAAGCRVEGQRTVCLYVRGAWGLAESESVGCFGSKCCWDIFFLLWPIYIGIGRVKIPGWAAAHPGHPVAPPLLTGDEKSKRMVKIHV